MPSEPINFAVVATLIIGTMLTLFIKTMLRNMRLSRSIPNETEDSGAKNALLFEKSMVYPFYVDCSRSIELSAENQLTLRE